MHYFFILLIVANAQLLEHYQITSRPKTRLAQILTEVQMQLKSGGSLETTISFLDNLKSAIDDEQIRHDQLYTSQRNQCAGELELRKKDIKDAEQVLNRATEQLENCSTSFNKARAELDNNLESQKITDGDIKILLSIRSEGARLFANKKRDHLDSLTALSSILGTLKGFTQGEVTLSQLGQAALQLIQIAMTTKTDAEEISTIFTQVTMQDGGYREVFEKLQQLIVNFDNSLHKNLDDYTDVENLQIQEYDDRRVHLIEYFNNLKRTEQLLRDHIAAMNLCQNQQTSITNTATGKKTRNTQIFNSAEKLCSDFLMEYDKASQVRKDQIDLIDQFKQSLLDKQH